MGGWEPGLVSVVIPAYNAGQWIDAALRSIEAQDHAPIELLVVDNGSTDDTVAIASAHAAVRVLQARTRGPSAAKNVGMRAARGEFLQFLDADDVLEPAKISRHVAAARATDADVVWGGYVRTAHAPDPTEPAVPIVPRLDGADLLRSFIEGDGFLPLAAALFRTRVASALPFDETRRVVEDVSWLIELESRGATFAQADSEAGLRVWEHGSANRASYIGDVPFYHACALNARQVAERWRAIGAPLTPARRAAVAGVWLHAAEILAAARDARAAEVLAWLREFDPSFRERLRLPHRPLARILGFERAVRSIEAFKRVRSAVRRLATARS